MSIYLGLHVYTFTRKVDIRISFREFCSNYQNLLNDEKGHSLLNKTLKNPNFEIESLQEKNTHFFF